MKPELRSASLVGVSVRAVDSSEDTPPALAFTGHAAVFDQRTWIGPPKWGFFEVVERTFFDDVLDNPAALLVNHDPNILLARNGSTMTLAVDTEGLRTDADLDPADPEAVMWSGRLRRGDISQMSFAFTVAEDRWEWDEETGVETRYLTKAADLFDASIVTYPAYPGTDAGMRDQAAEVVLRHRGYDPRTERRTPPIEASPSVASDLLARRHRLLAARHRLSV